MPFQLKPFSDAVGSIERVVDLAERTGVLESVRDALVGDRDAARAELREALDEVAKMQIAVRDTLLRLVSMQLATEDGAKAARPFLVDLASGGLVRDV